MLNEAEWIPVRGLANDLSWGKERSMVVLANYVLHAQKEGKRIARGVMVPRCPQHEPVDGQGL